MSKYMVCLNTNVWIQETANQCVITGALILINLIIGALNMIDVIIVK